MKTDPRLKLAIAAHVLMTFAALYMVVVAPWPVLPRFILGLVLAGLSVPGLRILLAAQAERFAGLGLALVLIIGAGLVEVMASGAALHASVLLGAAMLEFAVLFSLTRRRSNS